MKINILGEGRPSTFPIFLIPNVGCNNNQSAKTRQQPRPINQWEEQEAPHRRCTLTSGWNGWVVADAHKVNNFVFKLFYNFKLKSNFSRGIFQKVFLSSGWCPEMKTLRTGWFLVPRKWVNGSEWRTMARLLPTVPRKQMIWQRKPQTFIYIRPVFNANWKPGPVST